MLPLQVSVGAVASLGYVAFFRWLLGLLFHLPCNVTVTSILVLTMVPLLKYAVLDGMASFWFFHYVRCYTLCDLVINAMVCNPDFSIGVARDARRRDGIGTNAYL